MARLSKDERAELERRLKEDDDADDDFEIEIGDGGGNYARVPYRKGRDWLGKTFGIDVDKEPRQGDGDDKSGKGSGKQGGQQGGSDGKVRAFGRTVSGS